MTCQSPIEDEIAQRGTDGHQMFPCKIKVEKITAKLTAIKVRMARFL
jgi:hypothetical protein